MADDAENAVAPDAALWAAAGPSSEVAVESMEEMLNEVGLGDLVSEAPAAAVSSGSSDRVGGSKGDGIDAAAAGADDGDAGSRGSSPNDLDDLFGDSCEEGLLDSDLSSDEKAGKAATRVRKKGFWLLLILSHHNIILAVLSTQYSIQVSYLCSLVTLVIAAAS